MAVNLSGFSSMVIGTPISITDGYEIERLSTFGKQGKIERYDYLVRKNSQELCVGIFTNQYGLSDDIEQVLKDAWVAKYV